MIDLIKATTDLYGDCLQEVGSTDIYIRGVLATDTQMTAINARADADLPIAIEAARISSIKQAAGNLIISRYPIANGKQANMQAALTELVDKKLTATLTVSEQATYDAIKLAWTWIKDVRAASNNAEATAGLQALDIVWPS
jgi:hypothetical protein